MSALEDQLTLIKPLSWEEVFELWKRNEAENPVWIKHYKQRGFETWRQWRETYVKPLKLHKRSWALYEVKSPQAVIPSWHGGPFRSWIQSFYGGKPTATFAELAQLPDIQTHSGVAELTKNFPQQTTLIGLIQEENIVVLEGMHRCCAIAGAAKGNHSLAGQIFIALADATKERLPPIGQEKNPASKVMGAS